MLISLFFIAVENDDIRSLEEAIRANPDYADEVTFKRNLLAIMTVILNYTYLSYRTEPLYWDSVI